MRPALRALAGGVELARVEAPRDLGGRDWVLGVIAVQLEGAAARLRANLTGWREAVVVPLAPGLVHVVLGDARALPAFDPAPGLSIHRDGVLLATTPCGPGRAFGHVFCRWYRGFAAEAGFDLTPFLDLPDGVKYRRIVSEPLAEGEVITYAIGGATGRPRSRPDR